MKIRALKDASPFIIYVGAWLSFSITGWVVWLPLLWAWVIIPLAELFIKPHPTNLSEAEEELAKKDRTYTIRDRYSSVCHTRKILIRYVI